VDHDQGWGIGKEGAKRRVTKGAEMAFGEAEREGGQSRYKKAMKGLIEDLLIIDKLPSLTALAMRCVHGIVMRRRRHRGLMVNTR